MNLQISPIGIGIIAVYSIAVILVIAWPLSYLLRAWRWKWLLIVPLVLPLLAAPWAEEAWIAWHFEQACKNAGVHVYQSVEVEGYASDLSRSNPPADTSTRLLYNDPVRLREFDDEGYRFKEQLLSDGRVWHVERHPDGVYVSILDHPVARYVYKYTYQPTPYKTEEVVGWKLIKSGTVVVDAETNSVLGRNVTYTRLPNAADWQWIRFFGSGGRSCPDSEKGPFQPAFPESVLIPMKQ